MKTLITLIVIVNTINADRILDDSIYKTADSVFIAEYNIVDINYANNVIFIVERDDTSFKGLYALKSADQSNTLTATKILDNGRCTTSDNKNVFFGTSNGIYTYNYTDTKTEKHGNITANIKAIQKHSNEDVFYVISDDELSKVTDKGTQMKKIASGVEDVVLDKNNNVFFYETELKKPKVIIDDKIKEINGLPKFNEIKLIKSFLSSEGAFVLLDKKLYRVFSNGTSVKTDYVFDKVPTAFYLDLGIIQLFGHNKQLYQINILGVLLHGLSSAVSDFYTSISNGF